MNPVMEGIHNLDDFRDGKNEKGWGKISKGSKDMSRSRTSKIFLQAVQNTDVQGTDEAIEKDIEQEKQDVKDVSKDVQVSVANVSRPQGRYQKRERGKRVNAFSSKDFEGILVRKTEEIPLVNLTELDSAKEEAVAQIYNPSGSISFSRWCAHIV
ncbi:G-patch domain-containing protein 1 [Linum perenne]